MPGSGKSTIGAQLAAQLGLPLLDSDRCFEHAEHRSIRAVFAAREEVLFRAWEMEWLRALPQQPACVIATGGGMVCQPGALALLMSNCLTIWLNADPQLLWHRLQNSDHPMIQGRTQAEFIRLAESRALFYAQAHHQIAADDSPDQVLIRVCQHLTTDHF
jgi:shikimate kinase